MIITGLNKIYLEVCDSTQNYLKNLLEKGSVLDGTVVITQEQKQGRGMADNRWVSEKGKNLLFSFVRYPAFLHVGNYFMLNKCVALGVWDAVQYFLPGETITIKWPNDIYAGNRKICGMLIENSIFGNKFQYSVSGIGLNINQTDFPDTLPNPVSMKMITGKEYNTNEVLDVLCEMLDRRYEQLHNHKRLLNHDYLCHLFRYYVYSKYIYKGKIIEAEITGIGDDGRLKLKRREGDRIQCDMKEITYVIG